MLRRPYMFVLGLFAASCLVFLIADTVIRRLLHLPGWLPGILAFNIVLALAAAYLLNRLGCWRKAGFRAPDRVSDLFLFLPPAIVLPANLLVISTIRKETAGWELATLTAAALLSSFAAEAIYRGLMLRAVEPLGAWRAVGLSALLFAGFHAVYVACGADAGFVFVRTIPQALALGFCWAALALRTSTLWPLILIHFVMDLAGFLGRNRKEGSLLPVQYDLTPVDWIGASIFFTVFAAYGALLLMPRPGADSRPGRR